MGVWSTIRPTSPDSSTYADLPEDQDDWGCQQWRVYYDRNKASLGKSEAVEILRMDTDRIGWFADIHNCKYDCEWAHYFERELGEDVGNIFSKVYCGSYQIVGAAHSGISIIRSLTPALIFAGAFMGYNYLKKNKLI